MTNAKYKILLAGKNKTIIDDFFSHLDENIEPITTSARWDDILAHLKYFNPDALCFCAANEQKEHINQMVVLKSQLEKANIPLVVVGSDEDCTEFEREAVAVADLVLRKPLKAAAIEEQLKKRIDAIREEERLRQEEIQKQREEEERLRAIEEAKANRKYVMIVDDDATMLRTIKEQLSEQYNIATAISGKIALKYLEKKPVDLILLDYEMPGETGPEVLEQIRKNEVTKDTPVLFLTGVTDREKIKQALTLKPQGYLLKPVEHDKLIEAIEPFLTGDN